MTILYTLAGVYIVVGLIIVGLFIEWARTEREESPKGIVLFFGCLFTFFTWPGLIVAFFMKLRADRKEEISEP